MRYLILIVTLIFYSSFLSAQDVFNDSAIYRLALDRTFTCNHSKETKSFGLYTGSLYVRDYYNVKGAPFFQADSFQKGEVFYNGVLYKDVNLLYDLSHDNLVTDYPNNIKLILVPEKIKYFKLGNHLFVRLNKSSPSGEGFYDKLVKGKTQVWAKREKHSFHDVFKSKNTYFIFKGDHYYKVKTKKDVLNIMSDKKAEMKSFLSKNKTNSRRGFENMLVETVQYYDQIDK